jgi:transketolase
MRVGIATDHGAFALKEELMARLNAAGHQVVDFGAHELNPHDDYPDFVVPLAEAVASGKVDRGVAICGSGVGASVCANKVPGVRAGLVHDHFSAHQGVEDDHMNILCMGGRTVGPEVAWDLVQTYLAAQYSQAERHLRRLRKVASIEAQRMKTQNANEERRMNDEQAAQLSINTIRTLSIDAVQQAKSGHPGTPMALAPLVYTIWNRVMNFDPQDPIWPNRDRFVLSNGHASMLLWSILHLTQVQAVNAEYERLGQPSVTLDDIRRFRQLDSKAPGHPEYHWVSGVETTTGPLGQGVATSVGMALAQKWLANNYNRPGFDIFDYKIYTVCGDGCMMEGVGSEAASLAAHLGLDNLCWVWDNNHITIEGNTSITFTEDVAARFLAYGWNVLRVGDANDVDRIEHALDVFRQTKGRPTFIVLDSHIGYGSPHKQDTSAAHGEPLGDDEVRLVKRAYGWPEDAKFLVPDGVYEHFAAGIGKRGRDDRQKWMQLFTAYREKYPELATEIEQMQKRELPAGWNRNLPVFPADPKGIAGREASGKVLNVLAQNIPWFLGGSADLAPSNKTTLTYEGAGNFQAATPGGKNLHYGIREHAMGAIVNGMSLSKLRSFGATFFIFSDYARPAIRLAALMELPVIFAFTHDAMGDGEDGPTHQPVEHLASLRAIPGLVTLRPADANEVVEAYRYVVQLRHQPAVLALSRQPLPTFDRSKYAAASGVSKGAYVLADTPGGKPDVILIASGSEVSLAVEAHEKLRADGIRSRVVSMPSWDIFEHQTQEYRDSVLPSDVTARVAIEQASTFGWERYVGLTGRVIGMHTFGASAPLKELQKKFGFEPYEIVAAAKEQIGRRAA